MTGTLLVIFNTRNDNIKGMNVEPWYYIIFFNKIEQLNNYVQAEEAFS